LKHEILSFHPILVGIFLMDCGLVSLPLFSDLTLHFYTKMDCGLVFLPLFADLMLHLYTKCLP